MRTNRSLSALLVIFLGSTGEELLSQGSPQPITLLSTTSPAAGVPGVTSLSVTGSNFPAGTILPASVTVGIMPAAGGATVNTAATAVVTVVGTTRRVTFTIPVSISVSGPTAYVVTISGSTTAGLTFQSSNSAVLTVNPAPSLLTVAPNSGHQGQTLSVTLTGQLTNFVQGATQASFGAGISVGGAAAGTFGPVTVINATTATASLAIASNAALGASSVVVQTGTQQVSLANGFTVTLGVPIVTQVTPTSGQQGQTLTGVVITGAFTHFTQATPVVTFSTTGVTAATVQVTDNTHLTVTLTISASAAGTSNVTVVTGTETAVGIGLFTIGSGTAVITSVSPANGQQGQTLSGVAITGTFTHFTEATPMVTFSNTGVTASAVQVSDTTHLSVTLTIAAGAAAGSSNITVVTGAETATGAGLFGVIAGNPTITLVIPNSGQQRQQNLSVGITGQFTHFVQGTTVANFGVGITVNSTVVTDATHATANLTVAATASTGARTVTVTTGSEVASLTNGFSVTGGAGPTIADFNPKSAPVGTLITITGTNLQPSTGTAAQFTLAKQGGGTVPGFATTTTATNLTFVVPSGAATGLPSVTINGQTANGATALTIVPSSTFSVSAAPGTANLIQGQSVGFSVSLTSTSGFDGLATLSVSGVPSGLIAAFKPQNITTGQTSILTLNAPGNQPVATWPLTITASATVSGLPVTQTAGASVSVVAPTTSLLGRTVVSDSLETALTGVTVTMLGKDGNGATTGCTGSAASDAAGNFLLTGLSAQCTGPQLVGFDGTTVTNPGGKYAGVNLIFTLALGQVTTSPVLVHLPRIDNAETFLVQQNATTDQTHAFSSIPGLSVTVYAGTTFTMPNGTQPNPFPLAAVSVPVDRLPDAKPPVPTMIMVFIVAFQPANAFTNQPVAVYYPNTVNTPAGASSVLMTLDPTHGQMVPYGTGTVSADGTQFVPDPDPAHPGHRYGLVHFDWHMVGTPVGNQLNPCGGYAPCPCCGDPVDLSSGLAVIRETDISFGGARGTISIVRNYRNGIDPAATTFGPFGYGTNHNWGYELDNLTPAAAQVINLIMPDGNRFAFSKQTNGTFINSGVPSMGGAVMQVVDSSTLDLRWKDGSTFRFVVIFAVPFRRTLLDSVTDPNGNKFQITHNGFQIQAITDATGRSLLFNYNVGGCITQITAPDGSFVSYDYGTGGLCANAAQVNLVAVLRIVTHPDGNTTRYDYDLSDNLTAVTDGRGVVVASNTYDSNNRVIKQRQADGTVLQFFYTLQNPLAGTLSPVLATSVTDPLGNQTVYRFSSNGALIGVTDALGQTRTIDRDGGNFIVGLKGTGFCGECGDVGAGGQSFSYDDSTGNLLSYTDALGSTTTLSYDPIFNKVTSIKDALGGTTTFTYDAHGNLLTRKDPNGNVTSYQHDTFGELTQSTDPQNQTTVFGYDVFANLASIKDPLGNVTSLQSDVNGRLLATVDALGRGTSISYDPSNRITSQRNAQGGLTTFKYDQVGNLLSVTDPRFSTTSFTYDLMDRLSARTDPNNRIDTRSYDSNGNLIQFQDRRGKTSSFTYDALNRLTSEAYQDGSTVARSYDAYSRLANVNDSAGGVFAFAYDSAGRLTNSTTPFGTVNYLRDGLGRVTSRQVVGQTAVTYAYDQAGNLLSSATAAASLSRSYDSRNLVSTVSRMNGVTSQYTYDQLGRLASLTHAGTSGVLNTQTYAYDAVGNRNGATNSTAQSLTTQAVPSALYDADNEQVQFGANTNTFDGNGNLVSSTGSTGATTYSWDSRNRLVSVSLPNGQTTSFTYDFAGDLIQQKDAGPTANVTQAVVLDDLTNVAYVNRSDGDQYSVLAGQSIDDHLAVVHANGQIEYGLTDALNSTVATVDQGGARKGQFSYEPFGQTTITGSTYPFQYAGRVPVSNTLYYNRARFYNSQTGRFISEDPIGFGGGDANLYRYVGNNPQSSTDPSGTFDRYTVYQFVCGQALGAIIPGDLPWWFSNITPIGNVCEQLFPRPLPPFHWVECSLSPGQPPVIIRREHPPEFEVNLSSQ